MLALVPPKPKLLDSATLMRRSCAVCACARNASMNLLSSRYPSTRLNKIMLSPANTLWNMS
jgi:hypothetical protein